MTGYLLNEFIFKDIIYYLVYSFYKSFKNIIEISLINKRTFFIIQQIIINQTHNLKRPIYFNINYITNILTQFQQSSSQPQYNINSTHNNSNKLLKLNEIKILYLKLNNIKHNKKLSNLTLQIVLLNNKLSTSTSPLERIVILSSTYSYNNILPINKSLYKYNIIKLALNFNGSTPSSNQDEYDNYMNYNQDTFSYDFLNWYHPTKISFIKTSTIDKSLNKFQNIFNNSNNSNSINNSIKIIEFKKNHCTPFNFIKIALASQNNPSLEKLIVRYNSESFYLNYNDDISRNENEDRELEELKLDLDYSKLLEFSIKISNLQSLSVSLKKLIVRKCIGNFNSSTSATSVTNERPGLMINHLLGNRSLNTLGLEFFYVKNSLELSQLALLPNITTIYCDISSIESFFQHCNQNSNIRKLVISNEQDIPISNSAKELFISFFKSNFTIESLKIINNTNNNNDIIKELYYKSNNKLYLKFK